MLEGRETVPMVALGSQAPARRRLALWVAGGVILAAGLAAGGFFLWTRVLAA